MILRNIFSFHNLCVIFLSFFIFGQYQSTHTNHLTLIDCIESCSEVVSQEFTLNTDIENFESTLFFDFHSLRLSTIASIAKVEFFYFFNLKFLNQKQHSGLSPPILA